jgi:hypothetical protein
VKKKFNVFSKLQCFDARGKMAFNKVNKIKSDVLSFEKIEK